MEADEQAGLIVVGDGGTRFAGQIDIRVSRQHNRRRETALKRRTQAPGKKERQILLEGPRIGGAGFDAAVAGVDDNDTYPSAWSDVCIRPGGGSGSRSRCCRGRSRFAGDLSNKIDKVDA